jgi:hypothetical protein
MLYIHEEMTESEKKAFENGEHDRVLTLLERRVDAIQVRSAIAAIFDREFNENLEVHRDLLRLSRTQAGPHCLVTTNFDDLFQRTGEAENHIDAAPRLRSPKPAWWHTVVHLHGRLADQTDSTYSNLVLASEDFGQAYMLDGWATRFVVELFRNFTIVFVGYSLNDPVMRYLVDALAAARSRGEAFKQCYAFAAYEGETASHIETDWEAKGVTAIAYKISPTHHHLYETLKELADLHEEGLTSKQRLALRYADSPPVDAHDPIGQRVTWALSDPSGKVAQTFASMEPVPPLGWLRHLEAAGLLGLTSQRCDTEGKRNLLATQAAGTTADRLSDVTFHLARWLVRHVHNPELVRWVVSNVSDAEVQSSLRALSADELADVVRVLSNHLKYAADRAEEQWTKRIHPFIDRYWPRDNAHKSPAVSTAFSDLVLKTGNAFPSAVAATKKFLTAIHGPHMLLYQLRRDSSHLIKAFPEAILELLALTISQSDGSHHGLREVLDCLLVARPDFRTDRRFQWLERVA